MYMKMNIKLRMKHKEFWVALVSALMLLAQQLGLKIFPENTMDILNTVLLILTIFGIFNDPTTPHLGDSEEVLHLK